jgi:hypothetical protein
MGLFTDFDIFSFLFNNFDRGPHGEDSMQRVDHH